MKNPFQIYRGLPGSIWILFWVQVINRFGDFVIPFLALFLVTKQGFDARAAGLIVTIAIILQVPGSLIGGKMADRFGRKITCLISQSVAGLCILICAFVPGRFIIALLFISTFCGAAVKPTLNTMVYDRLPPEERKRGFSLMYLGINLGVAIGPLVAGFLFNHYLQLFFIGDAVTSFLAVSLVMLRIHDGEAAHLLQNDKRQKNPGLWADLASKPQIMIFFGFSLVFSFVYVQNSFALPLMLKALFANHSPVYLGYAMSINAVTVLTLTTLITAVTRKVPYLVNIAAAGVFYAVGFGMVGLSRYLPFFVCATILWTVGEILDATNTGIFITNHCEGNIRARYSSLQMVVNSAGKALGALAMGGFIKQWGIYAVWPCIMIVALMNAGFIYLLYHKMTKNKTVNETRADEAV